MEKSLFKFCVDYVRENAPRHLNGRKESIENIFSSLADGIKENNRLLCKYGITDKVLLEEWSGEAGEYLDHLAKSKQMGYVSLYFNPFKHPYNYIQHMVADCIMNIPYSFRNGYTWMDKVDVGELLGLLDEVDVVEEPQLLYGLL